MTNAQQGGSGGAASAAPPGAGEDGRPVVRDNRVVDPETGEVRRPDSAESTRQSDGATAPAAAAAGATTPGAATPGATAPAGGEAGASEAMPAEGESGAAATAAATDQALEAALALADERLVDLQRLNAEYVNYRKRVDRDRAVDYARGVSDVVDALIPILDDLHAARQHGELGGPFGAIAEKLEAVLEQRFGVERYGTAGEEFDPAVHEALMHATSNAVSETSVSQVLQPGYRVGERVLRAARVAVIGPE